ncbi:MAG TPA: prepilin peptidase [Myxococcota bacterium]|nr:prepilin peptidase [Myxococcota bacterium]HRY95119.1 prepilin peptidase [Myxococcota bacterium]HSA23055.1 prepilin peptidase [Myxococcota bacterium]
MDLLDPQAWWVGVFVFLFAATVGSFLNVVIYRLPIPGKSIVRPRSACPACGALIRWYDNVPILSFLWLRARCRSCRAPISWRYPLVEALTGALAVALWWRFGLSAALGVHFAFSAALVAIAFIDYDHRIIPDEISLPGIAIGFACSFLWEGMWLESLIGLLVGGLGLFLMSWGYALLRGREGMGMGDVKLLGMLGAWLGWRSLLFIALFASLQGVLVSVVLTLAGVKLKPPLPEEWELEEEQRRAAEAAGAAPPAQGAADPEATGAGADGGQEPAVGFLGAAIPFGPFLALAAVEYLFLGPWFYGLLAGQG